MLVVVWPRDLSQEDQDDLFQPEAQPEAEVEARIRDRALVGEELSQAVYNVIQYMQQDYRNFGRVMDIGCEDRSCQQHGD
jgi:hypothetical protein